MNSSIAIQPGLLYRGRINYKKLEGRVKKFHAAILSKDTQTLKSEFNYQMPVTDKTVELFSRIIPHALFCNYQGFMIGSGITWFDETGQIINLIFSQLFNAQAD